MRELTSYFSNYNNFFRGTDISNQNVSHYKNVDFIKYFIEGWEGTLDYSICEIKATVILNFFLISNIILMCLRMSLTING